MPRVRKCAARKRAHKRVLREARGYYGTKHRHFQQGGQRAACVQVAGAIGQIIVA